MDITISLCYSCRCQQGHHWSHSYRTGATGRPDRSRGQKVPHLSGGLCIRGHSASSALQSPVPQALLRQVAWAEGNMPYLPRRLQSRLQRLNTSAQPSHFGKVCSSLTKVAAAGYMQWCCVLLSIMSCRRSHAACSACCHVGIVWTNRCLIWK